MLRLRFILCAVVAFTSSGTAGAQLLHLPLYGHEPLGATAAKSCVTNPQELDAGDEGLLIGKGRRPPVIVLDDWTGAQGAVAFWIRPVDWMAKTPEHVVLLRPVRPRGGSFLVYKYHTADKVWFYGVRGEGKAKEVRVNFAADFLADWKSGQWHHVAFSWDRSREAVLYIDGRRVGRAPGAFFFPEAMAGISFGEGERTGSMGGGVQSVLRDVYVSRQMLGEAQVRLLAQSRPSGDQAFSAAAAGAQIFPVAAVTAPPVLNGRIDAGEYPTRLSGLVAAATHAAHAPGGTFCLTADADHLYFAAQVGLEQNYQPRIIATQRDDPLQLAKGDLFCLMIRADVDAAAQAFEGHYITIGANGNIYDAHEAVDWQRMSCARQADVNLDIKSASVVTDTGWTVELRIRREDLGLAGDEPFCFGAGFVIEGQRLSPQDHPVWFDHPQAFVRAEWSPVGVASSFGDLERGVVDPGIVLSNQIASAAEGDLVVQLRTFEAREQAQAMVVDQQVGQRLQLIGGEPIRRWTEHWNLEAGGQFRWQRPARVGAAQAYMVEAALTVGDRVLYRQGLPFICFPPISLELKPVPSRDAIRAEFSLSGGQKGDRVDLRFRRPSGNTVVLNHRFDVTYRRQTTMISMAPLSPGRYDVEARLVRGADQVIGAQSLTFEKQAPPQWLTRRRGVEALDADWVPAPWSKVATSDHSVSVWGRRFDFSAGGLVAGIASQDTPLLSGPVELKYRHKGTTRALRFEAPKIITEGHGRALVVLRGEAPAFTAEVRHQIEFDGMDRIDLRIEPRGVASVDRLWIEIPFKVARYSWEQSGSSWSSGELRTLKSNTFPHLWVGDDRVGCTVFAESCRGWQVDSRRARVTLTPVGGGAVLRLLLANKPMRLSDPIECTFGLHPTPVKPPFDGWRTIRAHGWGWSRPPTNLFIAGPTIWSAYYSRPVPRSWDVTKDLVVFARKHDQRVYPYLTPLWITPYAMVRDDLPFLAAGPPREAVTDRIDQASRAEEYFYFAEDWHMRPPQLNSDGSGKETHLFVGCSPSTSWSDYLTGSIWQLLERTDIDGLYFDLPMPRVNADEDRGLTWRTRDGVLEGTTELFATRDLYKRLYYIFETLRGPDRKPYILGHGVGACMPIASFWDVSFHGEALKPKRPYQAGDFYRHRRLAGQPVAVAAADPEQRSDDAAYYRSVYGSQFGLPAMVLPQYAYDPALNTPAHAREMIAWSFLHDNLLWPAYIRTAPVHKFWSDVVVRFGMGDAVFHPYWDNDVHVEPEGVKASYWNKPGRTDFLIAVGNFTDADQHAAITLPSAMRSLGHCVDMESRRQVVCNGGVALDVPAHDLRVLRVTVSGND